MSLFLQRLGILKKIAAPGGGGDAYLIETNEYLLLEDGDNLLLE